MRQLKFRVWTGTQMEYKIVAGFLGAFYVQGMDEKDSACLSQFNTIYPKEAPVMQFTGLTDKNGKEIYEGDIIKDILTSMISVIKFGTCKKYGYNGWYVENESLGYVSQINGDYDTNSNNYIELIGNIHEHAHLLTNP